MARGEELHVPGDTPDLPGYVELAPRSGFPEAALSLSERMRLRWLDAYVDPLLTRDAMQLDGPRDPDKLRRYFEAYALSSAGLVEDRSLLESAGLNRKTALAYEQLLLNLMVVERVPAWSSNRLKRPIRSPKRYLTDPGLLAGVLRLTPAAVLRDGDLLGRLLDTVVAAQLRAVLPIAESRPRLYHLRTEQRRHEVDLLVELGGGDVLGIEVEASAAPTPDAAKHLAWLRDQLGPRFLRGVVLHTGPRAYPLGERLLAAPISTFWA